MPRSPLVNPLHEIMSSWSRLSNSRWKRPDKPPLWSRLRYDHSPPRREGRPSPSPSRHLVLSPAPTRGWKLELEPHFPFSWPSSPCYDEIRRMKSSSWSRHPPLQPSKWLTCCQGLQVTDPRFEPGTSQHSRIRSCQLWPIYHRDILIYKKLQLGIRHYFYNCFIIQKNYN